MPKMQRPHKFQLCLSSREWEIVKAMAKKEQLTKSDLFRLKTIYRRLPRQVTQIAASTYWELAQEAESLDRIATALDEANQGGQIIRSGTMLQLQSALINNIELLTQVRKELVDLDLLVDSQLEDDQDDW